MYSHKVFFNPYDSYPYATKKIRTEIYNNNNGTDRRKKKQNENEMTRIKICCIFVLLSLCSYCIVYSLCCQCKLNRSYFFFFFQFCITVNFNGIPQQQRAHKNLHTRRYINSITARWMFWLYMRTRTWAYTYTATAMKAKPHSTQLHFTPIDCLCRCV